MFIGVPVTLRSAFAVLVLIAIAWPARTHAQSCHAASLRPNDDSASVLTYRVSVATLSANFVTDSVRGEYQGLLATASVSHAWFALDVTLPGYRIAQVGSHAYGMGDLLVDARANLYRSANDTLIIGPEFAATLPTGRASKQLGMGHVMLMPGGFLRWNDRGFSVIAQLSYGRALASGQHAEHAGPRPLVNPMNASELAHALSASARLHPNIQATGRLLGAVTLFDHAGAAREIIAPGLQLIMGAFDAALEIQVPIVGTPFTSRAVLTLGAQW
ncbi:MAG: hypothetical protein RL701_5263 [Pseudomonadota bacterium]|jgi:hypothetical protein